MPKKPYRKEDNFFFFFTSLNQWYSTFNSWRATSLLNGVVEHHKNQVSTVWFLFSIMTLQCVMMLPHHHHILIHHDITHQHPLSQQHSVFNPFWLLGRSEVEGWKGQKGKFFPILPHGCWVGGDLYSYLWGDPSSSFSFPLWEGELQRLPHCWSICSVLPALPDRVERRSDAYIARAACRAMKSHIRL